MRLRTVFAAVATAGVLLAGSTVVSAPSNPYNLKPGAKGQVCQDCHTDFGEKLSLASVHTPVRSGDCSGCHSPHASDHGKLLSEGQESVCESCHVGIVPENAASVHAALRDGACVTCHDPHASSQKNQLLQTEEKLCVQCHADVGKIATQSRFSHPPVAQGCVNCHDPHASGTESFLLEASQAELCGGCHDPGADRFTKAHEGYPVSNSRCTSCHAPHGSNQNALLWENVHPPVASKSCNLCHNDAGSANPLAVRQLGVNTCKGCHASEVNAIVTSPVVHWPTVDGRACLNCHNPHASKEGALLSGSQPQVCGSCHAATLERQAAGLSQHQPSEEGYCSSCHQPHAAESAFLLVGGPEGVCSSCHDWSAHIAHPVGAEVVDQRNPNLRLDCRACHRMHGTPYKYLTPFDHKKELCVQCHSDLAR